jgi:hypothetical protein
MFFVSSQDVAQLGLIFFSPSLFSSSINYTLLTAGHYNVIRVKADSSSNTYGKSGVHNFQMQIIQAKMFCMVAPNIFMSLILSLLHVTLLELGNFKVVPTFLENLFTLVVSKNMSQKHVKV